MKTHTCTRRDFIAKPAAALAVSPLLATPDRLLAATGGKTILTRTLGKTGIRVPLVSMGVTGSDAAGIVRRAWEAGVRHFDTAADYQEGKNELMLGATIKEMGVRRDAILATKVLSARERKPLSSFEAGQRFRETFEASLKRLQTDYVDILYLHQADELADVSMEGPLQAMLDFKKQGKARAIGISMHNTVPILNEVMRLGVHDVVLFPFNSTMQSDAALLAAIGRAHQQGIGIVAMKTAAGGPRQPGVPPRPTTGATRSALLKWTLHHPAIATLISAFGSFEHIDQNVAVAYDLSYSEEEKKVLADKKLLAGLEFCHQCQQCAPTCPNRVEIPTLMRAHMYALQYAPGTGFPHETLAGIPAGRGLDACASCSTCQAACAWSVNIARKIAELQAWPGLAQG